MLTLSTEGADDMSKMNPFCGAADAEKILRLVADAMLHVIRIGQTRRVLSSTKELHDKLLDLSINHRKQSGILQDLSLRAEDVARSLGVKRSYISGLKDETIPTVQFDPRYLLFEFQHNLMLRPPQVFIQSRFGNCFAD
jgi:hypothetical protein